MSLVLFLLRQFTTLVLLIAIVWSAGRAARIALRLPHGDGVDAMPSWGLTLSLGLALLAQACFLAALAGWLRVEVVTATSAALLLASSAGWRRSIAALATQRARMSRGSRAAAAPFEERPAADAAKAAGGTGAARAAHAADGADAEDAAAAADAGDAAYAAAAAHGLRDARAAWRALVWACGGAIALVAAMALLLACYPPSGFDQTMYHLPFARAMAASGAVEWLPALRFPAFPRMAEALNAGVLLAARDDVSTQFTGWIAMLACAGLSFAWARELSAAALIATTGPGATVDPIATTGPIAATAGWLTVACLAGSPMAIYLAGAGYVEPLLALFGLASLYAAWRASGVARGGEAIRAWALAAGLLAGSAAGVKYLGLFFIPAAAWLLLRPGWWRRDAPRGATLRALALFSVAAIVAAAPTYGQIAAQSGSPVFPFYPELFGANDWSWPADVLRRDRGVARLQRLVTLLWDLTFRRHELGGLPHASPAFVCGAPLAIGAAWLHPVLRRPLLIAIAWLVFATTHGHHFLGIAPLWSVLIGAAASLLAARGFGFYTGTSGTSTSANAAATAAVAAEAAAEANADKRSDRRRSVPDDAISPALPASPASPTSPAYSAFPASSASHAASVSPSARSALRSPASLASADDRLAPRLSSVMAIATVLALGGAAYGAYRLHRLGPPPATPSARADWLARQQPLYPAILFLNRTAAHATIYAVGATQMVYYSTGTLLGDHSGPASYTRMSARARASNSVAAALAAIGADYLLVPRHPTPGLEELGPLIADWRARAAADRHLTIAYADQDAIVYRVAPRPVPERSITP